ncbi:hypothetical protein E8E13_002829 [Curvularia kusanoi]|uniref:Vacuolar ATPase assembly protein VMA22 n=1 Tax=Curvularia kusanoi TaxID=90978 RepID=A0A9P4WA57_CURKU|nr:hypothetical protein E8E13_002829 [Curvularia kusanoi]
MDKDALITRLDALLEQYLHTLDEYEKLMQQLSKQLSSGFFSLTQANFHNRSGVHYGQDSYDERVQATRRIIVNEDEDGKLHFSTVSTLHNSPSKASAPKEEDLEQQEETPDDFSVKASANEKSRDEHKEDTNAKAEHGADAPKPVIADPIRFIQ